MTPVRQFAQLDGRASVVLGRDPCSGSLPGFRPKADRGPLRALRATRGGGRLRGRRSGYAGAGCRVAWLCLGGGVRVRVVGRRLRLGGVTLGIMSATAFFAGASPAGAEAPSSARPGQITGIAVTDRPATTARRPLAAAAPNAAAATSPPFTECPAIGRDQSCGLLIRVTDAGETVVSDPTQGPYDGSDDTLIGVLNSSSATIGHLALSSNTSAFAFDGDGCCSSGPTGYEGPGTSFSSISAGGQGGIVSFSGGIPPGGTAYFALEEPLSAAAVISGGPQAFEQGGPNNPSENRTTCSTGNPVNCATGTFWHQFTDTSVPGNGVPLSFQRTYSSAAAASDGPLGFGWTDNYNMHLSLDSSGNATVVQENGSSVPFLAAGGSFLAPPRVLASLQLNSDGTYTFVRHRTQVQYVFSAAGQLLKQTDRNGYVTTLAYSGGNLASVTDQSGRTLTFAYSGSRIAGVTDPAGHATSFSYDASGNLVSSTDPLGRSWTFTYDAAHLMVSMTDPRGGAVTNTYDGSGHVTKQVDPAGRATSWSYSGDPVSAAGSTTTMTDPRGSVTQYGYSNLELASVSRGFGTPAQATTQYQYDPATLGRTVITDPNGGATTNTFDSQREPPELDRSALATRRATPTTARTTLPRSGIHSVSRPPTHTTGQATSPPRRRRWSSRVPEASDHELCLRSTGPARSRA